MSKPRVFISSTCCDLTDTRANLTTFLETVGFEVLNSQLSSFGVTPGRHTTQACLDQVDLADYFILIIGARRGSQAIDSPKSITNTEYDRARERGLVIIPFVKKSVSANLQTFQDNPSGNFSSVVDDTSIFEFVMQIRALNVNNWLHEYDNVEDIKAGLRSQFAYYLLLYAKHLGQTGGEVFRPVTIDGFENGKLVQRRILATEALLLRDAL